MIAVLLVIAGVILLVLAGVGVSGPRFQPQWIGFGCLALAAFWPVLTLLTR